MFFGLGYMLGPALGSVLYSLGGFLLPFLVFGSIGLIVALALLLVIPDVKSDGLWGKTLTFNELIKVGMLFPTLLLLPLFVLQSNSRF